ncbi:hypothetical protein JVU11DRAFT_12622 [Chiua virens]|nr:hypothetical protein JVU11DRAFT_12622 [Chiua virens]
MPSFPYVIINAFTRSALGGNPAAVVHLPRGALNPAQTIIGTPTMGTIAKSLAQPVTVFVASPSPTGTDDDVFDIRFFVPGCEVPVCGHGTLATTMAICSGLLPSVNANRSKEDAALRFRTREGLIISASAVPQSCDGDNNDRDDGTLYEIELPVTPIVPLLGTDRDRVHQAVARALQKDAVCLDLQFVARGTGSFSCFLMVVLDTDEELDGRDIHPQALIDAGPFTITSLSHLTPREPHVLESRVFAPANGLPEDPVCGSAHTLMVPYYASLPGSRIRQGEQVHVRQVSPRGGDLWVTLGEKGIAIKGNAKLFAKGELML